MLKELIHNLANDKISLSSGLRQAKVIAKKIKNQDMLEWIDNELNGYEIDPDDSNYNLPPYRIYQLVDF